MSRYFTSRGVVYKINNGTATHKYSLQGSGGGEFFDRGAGGGGPGGGAGGAAAGAAAGLVDSESETVVILTGYQLREQEILGKTACLNDYRVMYSFGKGFGDITISGEALLGAPEQSDSFEAKLKTFYETNRVSQKVDGAVKFSTGQAAETFEFFLVGMSVNGYQPEVEILPFSFTGVLSK